MKAEQWRIDREVAVTLVDESGRAIGNSGKTAAHREGLLHRAVSVFIFDSSGRMLLQRRAGDKYHSGGLWANSCCTHPYPGERPAAAARRRLREEMGISCPVRQIFVFTYRADMGNSLIEHERDHVFVGRFDGDPTPDTSEVQDWKWVTVADAIGDLEHRPEFYAHWFRICARRAIRHAKRTATQERRPSAATRERQSA